MARATVVLPTPLAVPPTRRPIIGEPRRGTNARVEPFPIAFEDQRKPGNQQKHIGRHAGDALVHFAQQITEAPARRIGRDDATTHLVRHQHDRSREATWRAMQSASIGLCSSPWASSKLAAKKVRQSMIIRSQFGPKRAMVSANRRGSSMVCQWGGRLLWWRSTLRCISASSPALAVATKTTRRCALAQLLRVVAFAAAHASQQECHRMAAN